MYVRQLDTQVEIETRCFLLLSGSLTVGVALLIGLPEHLQIDVSPAISEALRQACCLQMSQLEVMTMCAVLLFQCDESRDHRLHSGVP